MILALVRKEWREHRTVLRFYAVGMALLAAILFLGQTREEGRASAFEPFEPFTVMVALVGSYFVVQRLVTREYGSGTQLFLASLPISRATVLSTKFVLGLVVLVFTLASGFVAFAVMDSAAFDAPLFQRVFARALGYVFCLYGVFFLLGMLGRYRFPFLIFLLLLFFALDEIWKLNPEEVSPFTLLGVDFATERERWPWAELALAIGLGAGSVAIAFGLGLLKDGSLAVLLNQRMSQREKVVVGCALLGGLVAVSIAAETSEKQAFVIHEAAEATRPGVRVRVSLAEGTPQERPHALAQQLVDTLAAARDYLALPSLPEVFVVPASEHDATVFERVQLTKSRGLVLAANLADPRLDADRFIAFALREVLLEHGGPRLSREESRWLLEGFAAWWATGAGNDDPRGPLRARAAAARAGLSETAFVNWLSTREQLGPCLSEALAGELVKTMAERAGPERTRALLQELLRPDAEALPLEALATEGLPFPELVAALQQRLPAPETKSAVRPHFELKALSPASWQLLHSLQQDDAAEGARYRFRAARIGPFQNELDEAELSTHDVLVGTAMHPLTRTLTRGDRWFFAFEVESPVLGCSERFAATRREIR